MSNNTEVIFKNIEQRILKEIESAHYAIFVSVAWFTNKKLFNALLEKAKQNCYVSIIIQLDEINSQSGIDYSQIQIGRSECFQISKDAELLHDKFCVIDFKTVITGSYNWTYKASHNSENILILNDPSVATQYISRFEQQKAKFQESCVQNNIHECTNSNAFNGIKSTSPIHKSTGTSSLSRTKKCPSCQNTLDPGPIRFCTYCGWDIYNIIEKYKLDVHIVCKKCLHRQNDAFNDATSSNFCTECGSKDLKWNVK